ncbi:MAG: MarR family transcriptional regulator [Lachnospiraceae bacterium]|nr:MarR family transcriptional regulator [Lachnospiraceae bacterium]
MNDKYDCLKLENQLCFPLYVASKEIIRRYKPFLDKLDLTYTQYIAMMVMWEKKSLKVTELCKCLFLDTGTVSPLIRKLKSKGYIELSRSKEDERIQIVTITDKGEVLKEEAVDIPSKMINSKCMNLSKEDAENLYRILYSIIQQD